MRIRNTIESADHWFWPRVNKTETCWLWTGGRIGSRMGYGNVVVWRGKTTWSYAHRVAWEISHGSEATGPVLHTCDVALCVRPDHLYLGSDLQNSHDMFNRERSPMAKISIENVHRARQLYANGHTTVEIAEMFGSRPLNIWRIVHYISFAWIETPGCPNPHPFGLPREHDPVTGRWVPIRYVTVPAGAA